MTDDILEPILSPPRRAKADLEEAKLAGLRPRRRRTEARLSTDDDEDDADELEEDLDRGPTTPSRTSPPWRRDRAEDAIEAVAVPPDLTPRPSSPGRSRSPPPRSSRPRPSPPT